ncbi:hypothetical protein Igag_0787 [Ignisphaera aggregans DSM 17230]|uniref:Uncharacterized protein n=1 Tax=Ignisphaera aggregans (strain DSM 17230 / JCM 13409 / AQ1.S1) TaxID=583356 RepID=E0STD6_IGNAA|nr:hypothetical protein Igag_0787 [Ignisphaera aggregans DSM 17230]
MNEQFLARTIYLVIFLNYPNKVERCNKANWFEDDRIDVLAKEIIDELLRRGINGGDLKLLSNG